MIVNAINADDLTATVRLFVRLETAHYAVSAALRHASYSDDRALLTGMRNDLRDMIAACERELGL